MFEFLTGTGLAMSAGLNAYIPLLVMGVSSRVFESVTLPTSWSWLGNEWVIGILVVLLIIEIVADKVPVVDSVNDWIQTIVRPTAGGLAFGSGSTAETIAVSDPAAFFENEQWVGIAVGAVIALVVHLAKMAVRPVLNTLTAGMAAPVVSTVEDIGSVTVAVLAIVLPVLAILAAAGMVWWMVAAVRRARRRKAAAAAAA